MPYQQTAVYPYLASQSILKTCNHLVYSVIYERLQVEYLLAIILNQISYRMKYLDGVETFCSRKLYHFARMGLCNIYYSKELHSGKKATSGINPLLRMKKRVKIHCFSDENFSNIEPISRLF